jgi:hypothetical protein
MLRRYIADLRIGTKLVSQNGLATPRGPKPNNQLRQDLRAQDQISG